MRLLGLACISIFLVFGVTAQNGGCPALYRRYSKDHTYCKPANKACNIVKSSVTPQDIKVILEEHNKLRNKIATGKESKLPIASNMLEMVWDDELAAVAQKHANQCEFEHDCNDCRRVQNFGVGQNLATDATDSKTPPEADWKQVVNSWYDEVEFFDKNFISPFVSSPGGPKAYGHFTQVAWAHTWRVGCGYVLYKEGDKFHGLYTCNYGPGGNVGSGTMYKAGKTCSNCPENSCCGCGGSEYPGLCKVTSKTGPVYKPTGSFIFYCDFNEQKDCLSSVTGTNKWLIYSTLSGNYLSILLKGGEESTMTFTNLIKPKGPLFCIVIYYRMGPNIDGEEDSGKATEIFSIPDADSEVPSNLRSRKDFTKSSMLLNWDYETQLKLVFSVPAGKPEQFFEVQSIYAFEDKC